jgi:flavin reductase (DIM6/NTAB) family NADH-FMN oxidoreductase RutF
MPEQNGLAKFPGGEELYYFPDALMAFDCRVENSVMCDDYLVIVSRVSGYQKGEGLKPLVRFGHGYASIDDTIFSDDPYPI